MAALPPAGGPDDPLNAPSLSAFAAAVRATLNASDVTVDDRIAAAGGPTRVTVGATSSVLAAGASEQGAILLAPAYRGYAVNATGPCRFRMYTTAAKRDADLARPIGTDPVGDHGLVLEYVFTAGLLSADLSPMVDGFDGKATPDGLVPYTITNTGAAPASLTVSGTWIRTEG